MQRSVRDFPAPLDPRMETNSPFATLKLTLLISRFPLGSDLTIDETVSISVPLLFVDIQIFDLVGIFAERGVIGFAHRNKRQIGYAVSFLEDLPKSGVLLRNVEKRLLD